MLGRRLLGAVSRAILGERYILGQYLWNHWCQGKSYFRHPVGVSSIRKMRGFKNLHEGQRCVIVGNGPSLKKMDLSFLRNEIAFGLNRIYLLKPQDERLFDYFVSVNQLVLEQFSQEIEEIDCPKFLSFRAHDHISSHENAMFFRPIGGWSFSDDITREITEGYTVTYVAIQIAYYMGFDEVILIGVDHSFQTKGPANLEIVMDEQDNNHFSTDYFPKGVRWQLPDLENSEISYRIAKVMFETSGRRILDATLDGNLDVFPKVDYREHFGIERDG